MAGGDARPTPDKGGHMGPPLRHRRLEASATIIPPDPPLSKGGIQGDPAGRPYGDRDLAGGKADTRVRPYEEVPKRSLGGKRACPSWSLGTR